VKLNLELKQKSIIEGAEEDEFDLSDQCRNGGSANRARKLTEFEIDVTSNWKTMSLKIPTKD
jgi:hypothetical protein